MNEDWLVGGILLSPFLYLLVTLGNKPARSEAEFEYGDRRLHPSQVLDSSITYSLQVAAISLFATWGYQWGLFALTVPLFWFLGYCFIALAMSEKFLTRFVESDKFRTLHSFLADDNNAYVVCIVAALITLIALSGPAMYEAFTVGSTVAQGLPRFAPSASAGIALAFIGMSFIYITWGGFKGVVRLDRWQLATGFGGFCLAFSSAIVLFSKQVGYDIAFTIAALCSFVCFLMALAKIYYECSTYSFLRRSNHELQFTDSLDILGTVAILGSFIIFIVCLFRVKMEGHAQSELALGKLVGKSTFGPSLLAFVSLFVANSLFQFVDITQWQRLLSIKIDRSATEATVRILRGNIILGGFCGTCTWCIAVFLGNFFRYLFSDPDTDSYALLSSFLKLALQSPGFLHSILAFTFVAGLVSIMSSTVDAMVSATSFTVRNDIVATGFGQSNSSTISRLSIFVVLVCQLSFYLLVSEIAKGHVDAVLYICYSCQLSLLPSVFLMLFGRKGPPTARILSMLAGCAAAGTPLYLGDPERAYEISPILSVCFSTLVYAALGGLSLPSRFLGKRENGG